MGEAERVRAAVDALSSRLDRAVAAWRAHLREEVGGATHAATTARLVAAHIDTARRALQQQLAEVVVEAAGLRARATHEHDAAAGWEMRAMVAIQRDDQVAAMEALKQHGPHFAAAATLDEELRMLDGMAETCRQVLAEGSGAPPALQPTKH